MHAPDSTPSQRFALKANDGPIIHEWLTIQDLKNWITEERKKWQWLGKYTAPIPGSSSAHRLYSDFFTSIQGLIQAIITAQTDSNITEHETSLRSVLAQRRQFPLVFSTEPKGAFVLQILAEIGEDAAHAALCFFLGGLQSSSLADPDSFTGFSLAATFAHPKTRAAKGIFSGLTQTLTIFKTKGNDLLAQQSTQIEATIDQLSKFKDDHSRAMDAWQVDRTQMTADWAALRTTFLEELRLKGPMEYWRDKASKHRTAGLWLAGGIAVLGYIALAAVAAVFFWFLLINQQPHEYWQVAPALLFVAIMLYLLRVVVRVYSSHLHLESDAHQRAVMIETFLAFTMEKGDVTPEQRSALWEAIFRPVTMGVVKEDPTPNSLTNLLNPPA